MLTHTTTQDALLPRADEMDYIPGAMVKAEGHHDMMLEIESSYNTLDAVKDDQAPALIAQQTEQAIDTISFH